MHIDLSEKSIGKFSKWRPLKVDETQISDGFWKERQNINKKETLYHGYRQLQLAGNFENMRIAAGISAGEFRGKSFWDSDIYKWLEAVAYVTYRDADNTLLQWADESIDLIEELQDSDGYINSYFQMMGAETRWSDLTKGHELYCAGHLIEAGIAFRRFLGQGRLLSIAIKFADCIDAYFGPEKHEGTPGHAEIELALVELFRETNDKKYLDLAKFFIDQRGYESLPLGRITGHGGAAVYQDHTPVRKSKTVEGHAVRQLYLTTGLADFFLETGEKDVHSALLEQWRDMIDHKMYFTGGLGQNHMNEAFGEPYELPNGRAYCETCAAVSGIMWAWRLLLADKDREYSDIIELLLYNAFLSGVSLDGKTFFYVNPLSSNGEQPVIGRKQIVRMEWPWTPCCPPNIMRLIGLLDQFIASKDETGIQIHQYIPATIQTSIADKVQIALHVESGFPWSQKTNIIIDDPGNREWTLKIRIPAWSTFYKVSINGNPFNPKNTDVEKGYLQITKKWESGDSVSLELDSQPHYYTAHPYIDSTRGAVAIKRGPLVFCLEQPDQPADLDVRDFEVDIENQPTTEWLDNLLGGLVTVNVKGWVVKTADFGSSLYRQIDQLKELRRTPAQARAIPYFAWANRGPQKMRVWLSAKTK